MEGEGSGAEAQGVCCCSMLGEDWGTALDCWIEEREARLLELWKTEVLAEAGADWVGS